MSRMRTLTNIHTEPAEISVADLRWSTRCVFKTCTEGCDRFVLLFCNSMHSKRSMHSLCLKTATFSPE